MMQANYVAVDIAISLCMANGVFALYKLQTPTSRPPFSNHNIAPPISSPQSMCPRRSYPLALSSSFALYA